MVCPSTPAAPPFARTSPHARAKMSSRYTLSYSAWNRRSGLAFAARYSALWSRRAASMVSVASSAFTSAYLRPAHRSGTAPSLRRGSVVHGIASTMGRSDSRSALPRFAGALLIGLVAPRPPPRSGAPRGLTAGAETGLSCSHDRLSHHSTPSTPPGSSGLHSKLFTPSMAFASTTQARLPVGPLRVVILRRGRLRFMLRTGGLHPPSRGLDPALRRPGSLPTPAGCYKGGLVPPLTGLAPASHRELGRTHGVEKPLSGLLAAID